MRLTNTTKGGRLALFQVTAHKRPDNYPGLLTLEREDGKGKLFLDPGSVPETISLIGMIADAGIGRAPATTFTEDDAEAISFLIRRLQKYQGLMVAAAEKSG
jgi:hypothetical protein